MVVYRLISFNVFWAVPLRFMEEHDFRTQQLLVTKGVGGQLACDTSVVVVVTDVDPSEPEVTILHLHNKFRSVRTGAVGLLLLAFTT